MLSLSEAMNSDYAKERDLLVEVPTSSGAKLKQIANPIKFSETKQKYQWIEYESGKHTIEVLKEIGFEDNEINEAKDSGLFG